MENYMSDNEVNVVNNEEKATVKIHDDKPQNITNDFNINDKISDERIDEKPKHLELNKEFHEDTPKNSCIIINTNQNYAKNK